MKYLYSFCIFYVFLLSCSNPTKNEKQLEPTSTSGSTSILTDTLKQIKVSKPLKKLTAINPTKNEIPPLVKPPKKRKPKYFYIGSKSGNKFFSNPNGDYLGTFLFNTRIACIENTGIYENTIQNKDTIKTEWLGIKNYEDTVYILDKALINSYTFSDINIYYASPYDKENPILRSGFINITTAPVQKEVAPPRFLKNQLGHDLITISKKYRDLYLKQRGISELDTIYISSSALDSTLKYPVKDLEMIAAINHYRYGDEYVSDSDYEIGFNLKKKFLSKTLGLVYIGKENIFVSPPYLSPIIFEEVDANHFPVQSTDSLLNTYIFTSDQWNYYIQNKSNNTFRHLVIQNKETNVITANRKFYTSESVRLPPLRIKGDSILRTYQRTGKIFKNKPPVILGLEYTNYACSSIHFILQSEPPILIKCDNRD